MHSGWARGPTLLLRRSHLAKYGVAVMGGVRLGSNPGECNIRPQNAKQEKQEPAPTSLGIHVMGSLCWPEQAS